MSELMLPSADAPIASSAEDLLDRGPFAHLVANALLAPNSAGATVAALYGPWGAGKSSVANLVVEILVESAAIVRFEPWMVTNKEALAAEFFGMLGRHVFPTSGGDQTTDKRVRFYRYASKVLGIVSIGANAVGAAVPGVSPAAGAVRSVSDVFDLAAQGLEQQAGDQSLREVHDDISNDLRILPKPLIVVIDDIDRLDRDEVRTLFQLIKACADFPNVRYLLLFDREQVLHALDGTVNDPGAFLEKIVTLQFDLPEATTRQQTELLDNTLSALGLHENLDKRQLERLQVAFDEVLLPGLQTVRQVKRYVSTVRALLPAMIVEGHRNVDPADFLLLEFLRQYVPSVYAVIRDEEAPKAGGKITRIVNRDEWQERNEKRRSDSVAALPESVRPLAEKALASLCSLQGASDVGAKRFNVSLWKRAYLGFHNSRAAVTEQDWQAFLKHLTEPDKPHTWLDAWADRAIRDDWVSTITGRVLEIPWSESITLLTALFVWGEQQRTETSQFFHPHHSWEFSVRFCVDAVMSVTPDDLDPVQEIAKAVKASKSIVAAGYAIGTELEREKHGDYDRWSRDHDLQPVVKPLRSKLTRMLRDETIWNCSDVETAMTAAHRIVDEAIYSKWRENIPRDEDLIVKYLDRYIGQLESFHYGFEEGPLVQAIRDIDPSRLTDKGRMARLLVLGAVESPLGRPVYRRRPPSP